MATISPGKARGFMRSDADELLDLMYALATYENYANDFNVTTTDLIRYGLGATPLFRAYVVPCLRSGQLLGMAVTYVQPWTYTLQPTLVLKELFVVEHARGRGVGRELMRAVRFEAQIREAFEIRWTVMHGNRQAEHFYRTLGGVPDTKWENWRLQIASKRPLTSSQSEPVTKSY